MIYADDFLAKHPGGAKVYDRLGREIKEIIGLDHETGEVIRFSRSPAMHNLLLHQIIMLLLKCLSREALDSYRLHRLYVGSGLVGRHGFWPAPLKITLKSQASRDSA